MSKWSSALLVLFVFAGCSPEVTAPKSNLKFFDLTQFVENYTQDSQMVSVTKMVKMNGNEEKQTIDHYPMYEDVRSFVNYDINRPALFDKYQVDTTLVEGSMVVSHSALDPMLKVQQLKVTYRLDNVVDIAIHTKTKSLLADVELDITFSPNSGYSLLRNSKRIFQDSSTTLMEVMVND